MVAGVDWLCRLTGSRKSSRDLVSLGPDSWWLSCMGGGKVVDGPPLSGADQTLMLVTWSKVREEHIISVE